MNPYMFNFVSLFHLLRVKHVKCQTELYTMYFIASLSFFNTWKTFAYHIYGIEIIKLK